MIVVICGSRYWTDISKIRDHVRPLLAFKPVTVITGGARGADAIAASIAVELGMTSEVHMAKWEQYGRAAGPIRNREMLDREPDQVLVFHENIKSSRGSKDTYVEALRRGIPVKLIE